MKDMLGRGEALRVEDALKLLLDSLETLPLSERHASLMDSYGGVLSRDVFSPEDLPAFSRSTMDGYAVRSSDTFGAKEGNPAYLNVTREILMGEEPGFELKSGEAAKISTGGMLPPGADAVLMFENAQEADETMIEALGPVAPGENVVEKGEDVRKGELVLQRGRRLKPQDVSVLAALGLTEAALYERPRVSVISTGDEIVTPETPVRAGLVRDSNSYLLAGLLAEEGALSIDRGILRDNYGPLRDAIELCVEDSDMVLISGGSSVGTRDLTERTVADLGRVLFHSVALRPGKPMLAGIVRRRPVFGLPGHPRAVSVCFDIFVRPVLWRMAGLGKERLEGAGRFVKARLSRNVRSAVGRREVITVTLKRDGDEFWAVPLLGKSGLITTMVRAEGVFNIPANSPGIDMGELIDVRFI
jgi:molybdopterin molybdotransferase